MKTIDLLISASRVLPMEPDSGELAEHAVAIDQGHIVEVLPTAQALQQYEAAVHIQRPGHALLPGLVNAHTHAPMNLMRGLADDLPLMDWLQNHIWPTEAQWVSPEFVRDGTRLAMAEMLRSGTTCFNEMYFFPDEVGRAAVEAGMRASLGLIVIDFPTAWAQTGEEYLHKGLEVFDQQVKNHPLLSAALAPHAPYTVSDEPLRQIMMYAEKLDIPVHMHVHETAHEVEQSLEQFGKRPIARLNELGVISPYLMAVHMTQLNDEEIRLLADNNAKVVHCPESNLKLASGFCPVSRLQEAGVCVALGTDGAASNNDLNMFGEMQTAALLAKGVSGNASALPAYQALEMATLKGAQALGLEETCGSLKAGKAADMITVKLDELETQPLYHAVSQLVYASGREQVQDVWVAGKHLLNGRKLTTLDEEALLQSAQRWAKRLLPKD